MREEVIKSVYENKLIVIVRGVDKEKLVPLAEAMHKGGIRLVEITYDAKGIVTDEKTAENISILVNHFGDKMHIGAGTVLNSKQVELTKKAGGRFIISPNVSKDVIEKTRKLGLVSMPGALTPTEIKSAYDFGADFVKIFPANDLGPSYIKAVRAPLSNIPLLAVGGINEDNMAVYLKAGACGFGIGSNIVKADLIKENEFDKITELTKLYVNRVNE